MATGQRVLLRATTTKRMLPPGPIQVRALLQHNGQTIAASPEITIDRVK